MPSLQEVVDDVEQSPVPDRYLTRPDVTTATFDAELSFPLDRIRENLSEFEETFPTEASEDLVYGHTENTGWTPSFWTGQCWLAWELTGDAAFREAAERQVESFRTRLNGPTPPRTHDIGFLYSLSTVAGTELTGSPRMRTAALSAAERLAFRFHEAPGVIQAWGDVTDRESNPENYGRAIVDTMMNLPLLFWATEATDDRRYAEIAESHAKRTAEHLVRDDGSTYHQYTFDVETGEALAGETGQGYADDSCWARGQAWAIYGYALCASYTGREAYADLSAKLANYFLNELPADHVPYWDFDAGREGEPRDSSAGAIAACGLDELARQSPLAAEHGQTYQNAALQILDSLGAEYTTEGLDSNGVIDHGVYSKPGDRGVDECCIWGDYFYLEGLTRACRNWRPYW